MENDTEKFGFDDKFVYHVLTRHGGWVGANAGSRLTRAAQRYPEKFVVVENYGHGFGLAAIYLRMTKHSKFKGDTK